MPNLNRSAKKELTEQMEPYVRAFDTLVGDVIHDTFADDPQLRRLASIVAETNHAQDDRREQDEGGSEEWDALQRANERVSWVLERRGQEVIAEKCEHVATQAGSWTDAHDEDDLREAVWEARQWLAQNTNAAERADVEYGDTLPDVDELFAAEEVSV